MPRDEAPRTGLPAPPQESRVTEALIVFTAFANEADAARVARVLVEERLVACANLLPGARSIYRWQDAVRDEAEVVVLMKTRKQDWTALLSRLHDLHPYQTPECIAVRIAAGAPRYMAWLEEALAPEQP
jgi:periplasmic divalent cation tolerance protein